MLIELARKKALARLEEKLDSVENLAERVVDHKLTVDDAANALLKTREGPRRIGKR